MSEGQVPAAKYAMPVGTGNLVEFSRFMLDLRDASCPHCRTGFKSITPKFIEGKVYQIPIMCTCVPYIANIDKDNNLIVVFKGVRELWPGKKRPEQYIQNDLVRRSEFDNAKANLEKARGQAKAHDGVKAGKYVLGPITASERAELGAEVSKSLIPKFESAEGAKPTTKTEPQKFLDKVTRKVAMRNSEGHLIVVDNDTALHMMEKSLATPERPESPEAPKLPSAPPKASAAAPRKGRGRPAGSKNKAKAK
jgi:hypothetical protein